VSGSAPPGVRVTLGRAPWTTAGELSEAQRVLVDTIRGDWADAGLGVSPVDSAGRLTGPFDLMVASPRVGRAVLELAGSFREGFLTVAEREAVVLVVAAHDRCSYMWAGHEPLARAAGVAGQVIDAIRDGDARSPGDDLVVRVLARDLCEAGDVGQQSFDSAVHRLGWPRFQEIVWLVGLYRALAMTMRVARIPSPHERSEG